MNLYPWIVFTFCWLAGIFAGMDATIYSVLLPQVMMEIAGSLSFAPYVISAFLMGWMIGGIFLGFLSDYLGRVRILALSIGIYSCFTWLTGFSQSLEELFFYRLITGIGIGGTMLSISVFIAETWNTASRAIAIGALITSYQIGVLLAGSSAHFFSEWRTVFIIGGLPLLLALCVLICFHEPAKTMQMATPYKKSFKSQVLIGSVMFGSLLIGYWASLSWIPTWMQELPNTPLNEKNFSMIVHGFCGIIGCIAAGFFADRLGRRTVMMGSFGMAFFSSFIMFIIFDHFSYWIHVYNGILGFAIGSAQAVMYLYLPELFPKKIRATCVGLCMNIGRIVTASLILLLGVFVQWAGGYGHALCLFSFFYVIGMLGTRFAPESALDN